MLTPLPPQQPLSPPPRLGFEEALDLYLHADLLELGRLAEAAKACWHPADAPVTFVIDSNVNYTNVCQVDCKFCAFYRHEEAPDAYVLPYEAIAEKAQALVAANGTQLLLQGGVNPKLPFSYYTTLLRRLRGDFPTLTLHAFSTSEIAWMAHMEEQSLQWVLEALIEAGLDSIPGAGAEILHDEVRHKVSPKKVNTADWLEVMEVAHGLGLRTSATMMMGMGEKPWHRVDHLFQLRALQERTGGFTAFIPWTFQPQHTALAKLPVEYQATAVDFLKIIALSRLVLDNVANIQSSWLTQGEKLCQVALNFGANDMGGLVLEEHVVTEAGCPHVQRGLADALKLIHGTGRPAAQRNTQYQLLRHYPLPTTMA